VSIGRKLGVFLEEYFMFSKGSLEEVYISLTIDLELSHFFKSTLELTPILGSGTVKSAAELKDFLFITINNNS
jgi:hypothetical protein